MNALAAFSEWGCEDRLSGPAFTDMQAAVGWFRKRDAYLAAGLQMSCGAAAGGIHAVAEIERGAVVASVPLSLLITQATAHAEPELRGITGTNLMALFLLRHNRSGMEFHAYVAKLPRQLDQTHRWSDEELSMLEASDLVAHSQSRQRAVDRHHAALPNAVRPSSLEAWGWALGQVWARSHTVEIGSGREGALAPLLDAFNHALRPNVAPAAVEAGRYVLRASRAVARGEELSVPYGGGGPLSNARLLFDYGFCLPDNESDDVALPLACTGEHQPKQPPSAPQLQLLRALRLEGPGARARLSHRSRPRPRSGGEGSAAEGGAADRADQADLPPRQALLFGRVCTLAEAELAAVAASLTQGGDNASPRPARPAWLGWSSAQLATHAPTVHFLRAAIRRREQEYTSPLERDEAARQRRRGMRHDCTEATQEAEGCGELPPREACAIEVRLAEKRILRGWREWAEARLRGLEASHDEL